jgi:hypothetical protein
MKWREVGDARPISFTMLLAPFAGKRAPALKIEPVTTAGDNSGQAAAFQVTRRGRRDLFVFNPAGAEVTARRHKALSALSVRVGRKWIETGPAPR